MCMVSVIIPTYNNRGGLREAVISALKQDYDNIEVIVVDDNAPESEGRQRTEMAMEKFRDNLKVVYLQHSENRNGAAARNTGIKAARGEYIAMLDDDDRFLPTKLKKQIAYLEAHPEFDAVYCLAERKGLRYGNDVSEGDCTRKMLMLQTCIYTPCQMFRRETLLSINGYDETFRRHQDYDLLLRFFHAGYNTGQKLEEMKAYFFEKFMPYIDEIDHREPGFKNKVLAKHYAGVFLNHVKQKNLGMAWNTLQRYFPKSPSTFMSTVWNSLIVHLKVGA